MSDGFLTTHVLDIGVGSQLLRFIKLLNKNGQIIKETITNADGRTDLPILSGIAFEAGKYSLIFNVKNISKTSMNLLMNHFMTRSRLNF